jgi:hypothetical protein
LLQQEGKKIETINRLLWLVLPEMLGSKFDTKIKNFDVQNAINVPDARKDLREFWILFKRAVRTQSV